MILDLNESKELCDWLLDRGLDLKEAAWVLGDLQCGDSLSIALLKVFKERKLKLEAIHAKNPINDWGNPITP